MMFNLYLKSLKSRTAKARQFCFDGLFELCNAFSNTRMKVFGEPKSRLQIWDPQPLLLISHKLGTATAPPVGPYWCVMVYWLVVSQWKGFSRILWKNKKCMKPPTSLSSSSLQFWRNRSFLQEWFFCSGTGRKCRRPFIPPQNCYFKEENDDTPSNLRVADFHTNPCVVHCSRETWTKTFQHISRSCRI